MKPSACGDPLTSRQELTFVVWRETALHIHSYLVDSHEMSSQVPVTALIHSVLRFFRVFVVMVTLQTNSIPVAFMFCGD